MKNYLIIFLFLSATTVVAQSATPLKVTLLDGSKVHLYGPTRSVGGQYQKSLRYAPFNLRLSSRDGHQEFSFLAYREDSTSAIMGGILHFLLTWGPTKEQTRELQDLIVMRRDTLHTLGGSLPMEHDTTQLGLEIGPPDHPLAQLLNRGLSSKSLPPIRPGAKMAASFSFTAEDARELSDLLPDIDAWQEVMLCIKLKPSNSLLYPVPDGPFFLTTSFASCLESLQ